MLESLSGEARAPRPEHAFGGRHRGAGRLPGSHDGKFVAYGLAAAGSDWNEWRVRSVETGKDTSDDLKWVKFSGAAWAPDNSGFYYSRYDAPSAGHELQSIVKNHKVFFHRLGTPQSEDALIYARPDQPDWLFGAEVTDDGRYLLLTIAQGTDSRNRVYFRDLSNPTSEFVRLFDALDARYSVIDNIGPVFYVFTDKDAPRGRIVTVDASTLTSANPALTTVLPESKSSIEGVSLIADRLIVSYLTDAASEVRLFSLDGHPAGEIALPALGSVGGFAGKRTDMETFLLLHVVHLSHDDLPVRFFPRPKRSLPKAEDRFRSGGL